MQVFDNTTTSPKEINNISSISTSENAITDASNSINPTDKNINIDIKIPNTSNNNIEGTKDVSILLTNNNNNSDSDDPTYNDVLNKITNEHIQNVIVNQRIQNVIANQQINNSIMNQYTKESNLLQQTKVFPSPSSEKKF